MNRIVCVASVLLCAAVPIVSQTQRSAEDEWTLPRTPDGKPDLQGFWTTQTYTPLQRPSHFEGRAFLTDEEMAQLTALVTADGVDPLGPNPLAIANAEERWAGTGQRDPTHYDNAQWLTTTRPKALTSNRTSLVVDPLDGRIPPMTPEAQARNEARRGARGLGGHEERSATERCLVWRHEGPPWVPPPYNDVVQIFQAPGYVVLFPELSINPVRIIPIDSRPPLSPRIRQWSGDSHGRWEHDTLVVETTNFTSKTAFQGSSEMLHVTERFTRVDADLIMYTFTVRDPRTWEIPWSAEVPMIAEEGPLYEYACHEGNYGIVNILRGARGADRDSP